MAQNFIKNFSPRKSIKDFNGNKKGMELTTETIVFVVLNIAFLGLMVLFIYLKSTAVGLTEDITAKQIALLIDAAKPGAEITINIADAVGFAQKNGISENEAIKIDNENNLVIVKLNEKAPYSYSFFNDAEVISQANFNTKTLYMAIK